MLYRLYMDSPLGIIEITGEEAGIQSVYFENRFNRPLQVDSAPWEGPEVLGMCRLQLQEYFTGKRSVFSIPVLETGTEFQKTVWQELREIPYGKTLSYTDLAQRLGSADKVRAVAMANARNRLNILIPCHRVVGIRGQLTGYGGELWRKHWLLRHENPSHQLDLFLSQ